RGDLPVVDWVTTTIASTTKGLPDEHATAAHLGPQRRRRLLRLLRRRHPTGRGGRLQPADRLPARPPGRAALATRGPRPDTGGGPRPGPGGGPRRADPAAPGGDGLRH